MDMKAVLTLFGPLHCSLILLPQETILSFYIEAVHCSDCQSFKPQLCCLPAVILEKLLDLFVPHHFMLALDTAVGGVILWGE